MVYLKKSDSFSISPTLEPKENNGREYVFVKQNNLYVKMPYKNLVFAKSSGNYVELITSNQKKYLLKTSVQQIENSLNYEKIIRIHRSYLINIDHLIEFSVQEVTLSNGCILPIGKHYQENFISLVLNCTVLM
ncbi:LytR/AlgR family response regulator transcription factor [Flectobacillus longus]|uniref:LytR/AlgR family response regulator transcription factor n=1 Tax=Flectobacillus longus TaxID=2984207 RepID=UPI0024B66351|nr:LytTR family DNA-binding domain-containing protein [Flectobacillus longus]MDI9878020.1 LytTR family DNA-binding domain-containing protein [Flectobacillus longus]